MNLAIAITLLRLLLVPVLVYLLLSGQDYRILAGCLFAFSGFTDFLDGYVARKLNIVTKLGRILDPLADKITLITVFIVLAIKGYIPSSAGVIIVSREIAVFLASSLFFLKGIDLVFPDRVGKYAAFLLYIGAAVNILNIQPVGLIIILLTIPLSLYSALRYLLFAYKYLTADKRS